MAAKIPTPWCTHPVKPPPLECGENCEYGKIVTPWLHCYIRHLSKRLEWEPHVGLEEENYHVWRGPCSREWQAASGSWEPQSYNHRNWILPTSNELGRRPWASSDHSPDWHLDFSLWEPEHRTQLSCAWTPDLQKLWYNKFICLKLLSLWSPVIQQ